MGKEAERGGLKEGIWLTIGVGRGEPGGPSPLPPKGSGKKCTAVLVVQ